jgi:hypothetical protein
MRTAIVMDLRAETSPRAMARIAVSIWYRDRFRERIEGGG